MAEDTKSQRFASVSEEEMADILRNKDAQSTQRSMMQHVKIFEAYLACKGLPTNFEEFDKPRLADILSKFYVEVRREDKERYKTGSMISIRAGLNRYLKSKGKSIDITKEPVFSQANRSFQAALANLKRLGYGDTTHYPEIDANDLRKLQESGVLNDESPQALQYKVWFEMMLFICRRGRENLRKLKKNHFKIGTDSDGRRFIFQAQDEMTKKGRDSSSSRVDAGRIYETRGEGCPVVSFEKYLSKLNPKCDSFFQTPMTAAKSLNWEMCDVWYKNCPVGERSLGDMMSKISGLAELSKRYTNHSLRSTCVQILDEGGFASRDIINVSGHSNEKSLRSYVRQPCDAKKQRMSDAIAASLGKIPISKKVSTSSVSNDNGPSPHGNKNSKPCTVSVPPRSPQSSQIRSPAPRIRLSASVQSSPVLFTQTLSQSVTSSPPLSNSQLDLLSGDLSGIETATWNIDDILSDLDFTQEVTQTQTQRNNVTAAIPASTPNMPVPVTSSRPVSGPTNTMSVMSSHQSQVTRNVHVQRMLQQQPQVQQQPFSFNNCTVTINYNFNHQ